ncbi:MAG TPA: S8 family serine peptidase [Longimicrobium sp.]|nr:S8 family serine peptidase [Longimicrobium sp.]
MTTEAVEATFGPPAPFEPPVWVAEALGRPTGKGLTVAVIDSGWDRACDDPRVLPGAGLVDPEDDLAMLRTGDDHDRVGHGTACVHQILRIAPDARVIPVRVFGNQLETSPGTLQAGILYAIERGVNVVNLSLGTTLEGTLHALYAACEKARRQGIIVVAAGHNSRDWSYPAIFENVIGVSAAKFESPYHYRYLPDEAHECQAWGVEQPVVWLRGEEQVKHGTSFAAPNITGIVCLLLERHPGATLEEIRELLARYAMETVRTEDGAAAGLPSPETVALNTGAAAPRPRKPRAKKPAGADASAKPRPRKAASDQSVTAKKPASGKPAAAKSPRKKSAAKAADSKASSSTARKPRQPKAAADKSAAKKASAKKPSTTKSQAESTAAKPAPEKPATRRRTTGAARS